MFTASIIRQYTDYSLFYKERVLKKEEDDSTEVLVEYGCSLLIRDILHSASLGYSHIVDVSKFKNRKELRAFKQLKQKFIKQGFQFTIHIDRKKKLVYIKVEW